MNQTDDQPREDEVREPEEGQQPDESQATEEQDPQQKLQHQLRRAMADIANLRKRQSKDLQDARQRAIEAISLELLPVLDNFHLAMGAANSDEAADANAMVEGLTMVRGMLEGVLANFGVKEIPAEGQSFDHNLHEAVGVDQDGEAEPGQITKVMQRGYTIGDKVLRASRVMVRGEAEAKEG